MGPSGDIGGLCTNFAAQESIIWALAWLFSLPNDGQRVPVSSQQGTGRVSGFGEGFVPRSAPELSEVMGAGADHHTDFPGTF